MRDHQDFIAELDYVAIDGDTIVGNIMYTRSRLVKDNGEEIIVLCFGPISVLPEYQGKGVGTQLIEHTKALAREQGYRAILIYGDPDYYKRVGFVPAETYHIGTAIDTYADALLAYELVQGALTDCAGRFFESPVYEIDQRKVVSFEQTFATKEKLSGTPSQERFMKLVKCHRPRIK